MVLDLSVLEQYSVVKYRGVRLVRMYLDSKKTQIANAQIMVSDNNFQSVCVTGLEFLFLVPLYF